MKLRSIVAAFCAATSQIMSPHSTTRLSDLLSSGGQKHGRPGQNGGMRLSSSLQDLPSFSRLDPESGGVEFEIGGTYTRPQFPRVLNHESGGSSFSKEKPLVDTPFSRRRWTRVLLYVFGLLVLVSLLYLSYVGLTRYWERNSSKYYVVLDCGSTGTRVYVYESSVDHNRGSPHLPIHLKSLPDSAGQISRSRQSGRAYQRMETEPGFDKLVRNESGLRAAIDPLLLWAKKQIPTHAHKSTSLFVYATAGVRRLPKSDSDWLLNTVRSILKGYPFLFQRDWIQIISGMQEAFYGWIALNYQMGTIPALPPKQTLGSLDLGGSSLQVTFQTRDLIPGETSLNLSIGDVKHHLSAYSLSGYGLDDAFDKSVAYLLRKQSSLEEGKVELTHPCLHDHYREQYVCRQCVLAGKSQSGLPVTLLGRPSWEECSTLAKTTVNLSEWSTLTPVMDCEKQPCALPESLPRPQGQFYAMSGFFVVYKFFSLNPDATLNNLLAKGKEFCETTWDIAKNSVAPQPFIEQYCFRAPYVVSLLRDGLHIDDNQVSIGSGRTTWTLGVALLAASRSMTHTIHFYGYGLDYPQMSGHVLVVLLLLSLMLLFFAISYVKNWVPRFFQRSYLPLYRQGSGSSGSFLSGRSYLQRWNLISSGDTRIKLPLSPTTSATEQPRPFGTGHGLNGSSSQLSESSQHPSGGVLHSFSSGSLGQVDSAVGPFWTSNRSQMQLQSRRSQSREDLSSSLAEIHLKG